LGKTYALKIVTNCCQFA